MTERNDPQSSTAMHLKVLLPTEILVDEEVVKVIAEAENGEFCLLPRHIDFTASLVPGVLYFYPAGGAQSYVALDEGVLVKCGHSVQVATLNGVRGNDLDQLQTLVEEQFLMLDEHVRKTRTALARLEAGTLRRFRNLQEQPHD